MKDNKIVFYDLKKHSNNKIIKAIFKNTFFIVFLMFLSCFSYIGTFYYFDYKYMQASVNNAKIENNNNISDTINKYNNDLKAINKTPKNKYEILINKSNLVSENDLKNYEIVNVNNNLFMGLKIEKETYNNYLNLKENLKQRGYNINIKKGFMDITKSSVEQKGTSEHNTGLAIDIVISEKKKNINLNYESNEYLYLKNIAHLYGFIIRYPKEKERVTGYNYNPYHLRYVGKKLAKYLKKNNLTLEEYYEIH